MEDFTFDQSGLLSDEEAEKLFGEDVMDNETQETVEDGNEPEKENEETVAPENDEDKFIDNNPAEEHGFIQVPESVGKDDKDSKETEDAEPDNGGGSSPDVFYSSIASALKDAGVFPDLDDETVKNTKSAEDFAELIEEAAKARLEDQQRRVYEALNAGVPNDTVRQYEQTIQYLDSINEESLSAEGDDGENLRKQILYNDFINRGFTQDRANREIKKSFDAGTDVEDAQDALEGLRAYYKDAYSKVLDDADKAHKAAVARQRQSAEELRKMVMEDELVLGDQKLDKNTRQRVYDAVSKPVYKDPETGKLLTQIQKFQKEKPLEFLKQIGLWYVLTDGGKDLVGFTKGKVRDEKLKAIRDLTHKIKTSSMRPDGSLRFATGGDETRSEDVLLSDDWNIG